MNATASMRPGRLPIDQQLDHFRAAVRANTTLMRVLDLAAGLHLPDWYLLAGCLCQTVWNVITGRPPDSGILDYDLGYFDPSDLSWEAEDAVIRAGRAVFGDIAAPVQIRNQARVHLWYEQKFGVPCPAHQSSEAAIDTFEATCACLGLRLEPGGTWRIYAPHGLSDVFNLVVRPSPVLAPRQVYEAKVTPVAAAVAHAIGAALARPSLITGNLANRKCACRASETPSAPQGGETQGPSGAFRARTLARLLHPLV